MRKRVRNDCEEANTTIKMPREALGATRKLRYHLSRRTGGEPELARHQVIKDT